MARRPARTKFFGEKAYDTNQKFGSTETNEH